MKKYRAIFFDWDGTAVQSRKAPCDDAIAAMRPLLERGVALLVISGTTYGNIGGGKLHEAFTPKQLQNLYLGLGRGSYHYGFDEAGRRMELKESGAGQETLLKIHDTAYAVHRHLLERYGYTTDIIFDRPNYCKIDLMNTNDRATSLFLSGNEITDLKENLRQHGFSAGIGGLIALAERLGEHSGIAVKATCDAKYLEVGVFNKSDNVDTLLTEVLAPRGIAPADCCFWGDEYLQLDEGIMGSDSFMHTERSQAGDFFDVGTVAGERPRWVHYLGGSVDAFLSFLREQARCP